MKKLKQHLLFTSFSCLVLLVACTKSFTTQNPSDSVPLADALSTESGLNDALNGAYASLRSINVFGANYPLMGDLLADNVYIETHNSAHFLPQYNYAITSNDLTSGTSWRWSYTSILNANQVINAKVSGPNIAAIKAQAYAIRALEYFKMVNIFARPYTDNPDGPGVPIVLTYNPDLLPGRNTIREVYAQIISDYQAALKDAPEYSNSVHLSKYAIEALLAKAYLYEGDNANAKTAAEDVIANSGFTLVTPGNFNVFWSNPAIQTDQIEVMFEIDEDGVNNNGTDDVASYYVKGYQDMYASSQLYDLYSATDVRRSLLDSGFTKGGADAYIVNKFPNPLSSDFDNLKVIRLAEVYLIAAEASLPDNEPLALQYLNALMAQRDPGFVYSSTGAQLLSDIVQERRKELAFEGDRIYDLNRLKLPVNRIDNPGAIPAGPGGIYLTVPYSDYRRVAPISLTEIEANPNIADQQNPGY